MPRTIPVTRPSAASLGVGRGRALLGQPAPRRGESVSGPGQGVGAAIRGVLGGAWTASSGRLSRGVTAVTGRTPCPFLCVWPHTPTPPPAARRGEWRPGVSVEPRTARPARSGLHGDVECGPLPPPQSGTGHPKGGGAPRQLAGEPGRSEEGALRRAARCGRQGTPRHLGCSRPGLRLPSAGPVARAGSWGRRPPAGGAGRVASVSHACHNAWLALPASVIEIHCQIY